MNLEHLQFDLAEAHLHLEELVREIESGTLGADDSPELAVNLEHITDHLHRAWNRRTLAEKRDRCPHPGRIRTPLQHRPEP